MQGPSTTQLQINCYQYCLLSLLIGCTRFIATRFLLGLFPELIQFNPVARWQSGKVARKQVSKVHLWQRVRCKTIHMYCRPLVYQTMLACSVTVLVILKHVSWPTEIGGWVLIFLILCINYYHLTLHSVGQFS